jgi:putative transposase
MELPENDVDFSTRWRLIKRYFSVRMSAPLNKRGEKKIWQRRFWEHLIKDDNDLHRHMDYIHYNPVKHGYVRRPEEWEYSSYRRQVVLGSCSKLHENAALEKIENMNLE